MTKNKWKNLLYELFVIAFGLILLYPILWLIFASFKTDVQIHSFEAPLLPTEWHFENYSRAWKGFGGVSFSTYFSNSIVIAVLATVFTAISSAIVAYGFARIRFKGKKIWFALMMVTMMIPSQVLIIPQYIIFSKLQWVGTFLPLVVPHMFTNAFFVFLIMQFIQGLPIEMDEAAIIDGCSRYTTFSRIILPLIKPALISTIVIQFYWKWDEFMGPLMYLNKPEDYTVALAVKAFADATSTTDYSAMFAISVLSMIPVFLLFFFFNHYLVEGITMSGLKG